MLLHAGSLTLVSIFNAGDGSMIAHELSEAQLVELARRTEGYSGGDIATLIESACWMPVKHAVHRGTLEQGSPQPLRPANLIDFKVSCFLPCISYW